MIFGCWEGCCCIGMIAILPGFGILENERVGYTETIPSTFLDSFMFFFVRYVSGGIRPCPIYCPPSEPSAGRWDEQRIRRREERKMLTRFPFGCEELLFLSTIV